MRKCLMAAAMLAAGAAQALEPREGWVVQPVASGYGGALEALRAAIAAEGMVLVTEAGPTEAAASRGVTIPGNRLLGVFRNDFAVRALAASEAAMIEAPIRFYVSEQPDGTAVLAWKTPGHVLAPYLAEGGPKLAAVAAELDAIFAAIAARVGD
jgi:uncharacterized protein (DUF302 family)